MGPSWNEWLNHRKVFPVTGNAGVVVHKLKTGFPSPTGLAETLQTNTLM